MQLYLEVNKTAIYRHLNLALFTDIELLRIMLLYFMLMVLYFYHCSKGCSDCEPLPESACFQRVVNWFMLSLKRHELSRLEERSSKFKIHQRTKYLCLWIKIEGSSQTWMGVLV